MPKCLWPLTNTMSWDAACPNSFLLLSLFGLLQTKILPSNYGNPWARVCQGEGRKRGKCSVCPILALSTYILLGIMDTWRLILTVCTVSHGTAWKILLKIKFYHDFLETLKILVFFTPLFSLAKTGCHWNLFFSLLTTVEPEFQWRYHSVETMEEMCWRWEHLRKVSGMPFI